MRPVKMEPQYEGCQAVLLARFIDDDATPLVQADISTITAKCYNKADPANIVASASLSAASNIFDTLQTWPVVAGFTAPDTTGYNFRYKTPIGFFPQGDQEYVVEIVVTEAGGDVSAQTWIQETLNLHQR